jgi:hypothetical protein
MARRPGTGPAGECSGPEKTSRLCESDVQQRDDLLKRLGGPPTPFGEARSREADRVYRRYDFR